MLFERVFSSKGPATELALEFFLLQVKTTRQTVSRYGAF